MKVVLYSTNCPRCKVLKKKLDSKTVFYTEVCDVDFMMSRGITEVPVLQVDDKLYDFKSAVEWINNL